MKRLSRLGIAVASLLGLLLALHVQLNLGGWPRFLRRLGSSPVTRGELIVGFLPVT